MTRPGYRFKSERTFGKDFLWSGQIDLGDLSQIILIRKFLFSLCWIITSGGIPYVVSVYISIYIEQNKNSLKNAHTTDL